MQLLSFRGLAAILTLSSLISGSSVVTAPSALQQEAAEGTPEGNATFQQTEQKVQGPQKVQIPNKPKKRPRKDKRQATPLSVIPETPPEKRFTEAPTIGFGAGHLDANVVSGVDGWLVLAPVDLSGRRPLRADAVLAQYGMARDIVGPKVGEVVRGELDVPQIWDRVQADASGLVSAAEGKTLAVAYTTIEAPHAGVIMVKLGGASILRVGNRSYAGDVYNYGFRGFPVELAKGTNHVFVNGVRGSFSMNLWLPEAPLMVATWDLTLPDLLTDKVEVMPVGIPLVNTTLKPIDVKLFMGDPMGTLVEEQFAGQFRLQPTHINYLPMGVAPLGYYPERFVDLTEFSFPLIARDLDGNELMRHEIVLDCKKQGEAHMRTFFSLADNSVQKFAVLPPSDPEAEGIGMLLTLHGAGVEAWDQIQCYPQQEDILILAPTNRRPYGFDWQDWGRNSAYHSYLPQLHRYKVDYDRMYLTGHSMGGHGTWHFAAIDPDQWAAIAPCAGWRSFDTYGSRPEGSLRDFWHAADHPSRTEDLLINVTQTPAYIYHGGADETVPVGEAQAMASHYERLGGEHVLDIAPGQGHWFDGPAPGTDCVAKPELLDFLFSKRRDPTPTSIRCVFTDPMTDASHHWFQLTQVERYGEPSVIEAFWDEEGSVVTFNLENVQRFTVRKPVSKAEIYAFSDGTVLAADGEALIQTFERGPTGKFEVAGDLVYSQKRADKAGPLKRGWGRKFLVVLPTGGKPEENRASRDRYLYDASVWGYRGNGVAYALTDVDFLAQKENPLYGYNNLIVYGNAHTNKAWNTVVPPGPIRIQRGVVTVNGERTRGGGLLALFVTRRLDTYGGVVLVNGSSGPYADRLAPVINHFGSGATFPDFTIASSEILTKGDEGVLQAGWFDRFWALQE